MEIAVVVDERCVWKVVDGKLSDEDGRCWWTEDEDNGSYVYFVSHVSEMYKLYR